MTGAQLKQLRLGLRMTQAEFGEALGLSGVWIGLMERGTRPIEIRTELAARWLAHNAAAAPWT